MLIPIPKHLSCKVPLKCCEINQGNGCDGSHWFIRINFNNDKSGKFV